MTSNIYDRGERMRRSAFGDAISAVGITLISALPYLTHLGFYSDDWSLLVGFYDRQGETFASALLSFQARPVQGLYLGLLSEAFGLHPLGYHAVNTAVLAASVGLFYTLLRRLELGRAESFVTTLLFIMLPQLSTVRVWYAAFQIPLSAALALISMHCQLSFGRSMKLRWLAGAAFASVLSIGAYEIFMPLIGGFALAIAFEGMRTSRHRHFLLRVRTIAGSVVILALVVLGFVYKLAFSGRGGAVGEPKRYLLGLRQLIRVDYDWRTDSGLNIIAMFQTHFLIPIQGWWKGAVLLISGRPPLEVIVITILIVGVAWWRLSLCEQTDDNTPNRLLLYGVAAFVLGNVTFLIVPAIVFTSTGMGNRVHFAAAFGAAMILAAFINLTIRALTDRHRATAMSGIIVAVTAASFVRLTAIESYWAEAPVLQERVLNAALVDLQAMPSQSEVILDGICPYHGPAVVFETNWDVGAALSLILKRPIGGDVVSPRMSLTTKGITTSVYKEPAFYAYGPNLYIYNPVKHLVIHLWNALAAAAYFKNRDPSTCTGLVARGSEV